MATYPAAAEKKTVVVLGAGVLCLHNVFGHTESDVAAVLLTIQA